MGFYFSFHIYFPHICILFIYLILFNHTRTGPQLFKKHRKNINNSLSNTIIYFFWGFIFPMNYLECFCCCFNKNWSPNYVTINYVFLCCIQFEGMSTFNYLIILFFSIIDRCCYYYFWLLFFQFAIASHKHFCTLLYLHHLMAISILTTHMICVQGAFDLLNWWWLKIGYEQSIIETILKHNKKYNEQTNMYIECCVEWW